MSENNAHLFHWMHRNGAEYRFFEPDLDSRDNLNKNKKIIDMGVAVAILQLSEP
jgi:hypothetical protein